MFLRKIDTPRMLKEGENFAYRVDTDVSVHCDFILSHCSPTPKPNDDLVEVFWNGFAMDHGVNHEIQRQQKARASVHAFVEKSLHLRAPDFNQS